MREVDLKTLAEATRRYARLRWVYWRFFLGGIVIFGVIAGPHFVFESQQPTEFYYVVTWVSMLCFVLCQLVCFGAWHALTQFRCPRCGERFIMAWWSSWPTEECKHCGLKLERDFAKPKDSDRRHFNDDFRLSV